jgi:hypothetical protein
MMAVAGPEGRRTIGDAARVRIVERYDLAAVVDRYEAVYQATVEDRHRQSDSVL